MVSDENIFVSLWGKMDSDFVNKESERESQNDVGQEKRIQRRCEGG